jgi:DNA-binding GntR family transcriptional regulator
VSRTPLREAFRMLAADGLLVQLPNRGAQVVSLSREDVRHAFEVMASLEACPASWRRRASATPTSRAACAAGRDGAGARAARPADLLSRQPAIHDRINAVAGNPILAHTFKTLNARLHALRFRSNLVQAKWDHAVQEHREMIEALAAATASGCATCWIRHVRTKLRTVLETMGEE